MQSSVTVGSGQLQAPPVGSWIGGRCDSCDKLRQVAIKHIPKQTNIQEMSKLRHSKEVKIQRELRIDVCQCWEIYVTYILAICDIYIYMYKMSFDIFEIR